MSIGEVIKNKRKNLGYSIRFTAKKIGASESSLGKWECGMGLPRGDRLLKLMFFLQLSKEDFQKE